MRTFGVIIGYIFAFILYIAVSLGLLALSVVVVVWVLQQMGVL